VCALCVTVAMKEACLRLGGLLQSAPTLLSECVSRLTVRVCFMCNSGNEGGLSAPGWSATFSPYTAVRVCE